MFRAHYERGFMQTLYCFVGTFIGGARTCRRCECRYTCRDYSLRRQLWTVAYGRNLFAGIMRLDVE